MFSVCCSLFSMGKLSGKGLGPTEIWLAFLQFESVLFRKFLLQRSFKGELVAAADQSLAG